MALTKEDLQAISALMEPIRNEIGELRKDVTELKRDVAGLKWDVTGLKQDVMELKQDVAELKQTTQALEQRTERLEQRTENLEQRMGNLEQRMGNLEQRADRMEIILENETNRNIRIIAEGHRDLNRRLSEVLKLEDEKETLLVRVNLLERDVRILKEKII